VWRARLLEKLYSFAVIFGSITFVVAGIITISNGYYIQILLYTLAYIVAIYATYKKGLNYNAKVYSLIFVAFWIALTVLILEGDLTVGLIWIVFGTFLAITFFDRKKYLKVLFVGTAIIALWYLNYLNGWVAPVHRLNSLLMYVKYTNSMVFFIAGIIYVNNHLIHNISKSLESERLARRELQKEKVIIKNTNASLASKVKEIERLRNRLQIINAKLSDKVGEQELSIKQSMEHLKTEIVKHRKTERELIKTKEELILALDKEKALNELKSRFITMISHEYRTPLTVLSNSAYLLDKYFEANAKEKFYDSLDKINYSVKSMANLLEDVIRFGYNDTEERDNELAELDIINQLETIIANFEHQDGKKYNISIQASENPFIIKTDARKVRLILNNIIKNAITYNKEKVEVTVTVNRVGKKVYIVVADNGIGIANEDMSNLFEPFYRGGNTIGKSGMGLGLPISKRYVDSLKGEITFESQVGKGSSFTVVLPINMD
jgi:signal transduction histidine kinase